MTGQKRAASKPAPSQSKRQADDMAGEFHPPLKPHPKLMMILAVILTLWLIALIIMRQTTIHQAPTPPAHTVPAQMQ